MLCYKPCVIDTVSLLRERLAKAEAKVTRAERSLEAARNEVGDIQTTLRVLDELAGETKRSEGGSDQSNRLTSLLLAIPDSEFASASPAEMWEGFKLVYTDPANLEAFRTAVWRMKDKSYTWKGESWIVRAADGRYWRETESVADDSAAFSRTGTTSAWDEEDDPPF